MDGRLLETPAAGYGQIVQVCRAEGRVDVRVSFPHVQESDIRFQSPLEMRTCEECYAGLDADVISTELLKLRIGDIVVHRRYHIRECRAEADNDTLPACVKMIASGQEDIREDQSVTVSAVVSPMHYVAMLRTDACTGHYGQFLTQSDVQSIGKTEHCTGILLFDTMVVSRFQKQPTAKLEDTFNRFGWEVSLR